MTHAKLLRTVIGMALLSSHVGSAAAWKSCDGTPVRPKYMPMGIAQDICSMPQGSQRERAFLSGLFETRFYVHAISFLAHFQHIHNGACIITHDDGRSDVAVVPRSEIDGGLGLTIKQLDWCTSDQFIIEADVMAAAELDFTRADESRVITSSSPGTKIGALVMLHELGHAIGLEHTSAFAVMRDGLKARAPFVGMTPGSGGLGSELLGDDVFGISRIYGFNPGYRNVFVSSQLIRNGMLVDNNINPKKGDAQHPDPLPVCPGDTVNFYASIGNDGPGTENILVALHADSDANAYPGGEDGALQVYDVSINGRQQFWFPVDFTVPASMPANVTQNIFVSLAGSLLWERKGYDDSARSRLRIRRKPGC